MARTLRPSGGKAAVIGAFIAATALLSGTQAAGDDASERQAVIDAMQSWERAVEAGDYQALETHYMPDAVYYPHNSAPVIGREAIIERNRQRGAESPVDIVQKVDDVQVQHDWAIYSCLAKISAGQEPRHVRVLLIMQKDSDGRWKILRDIDNGTPETF